MYYSNAYWITSLVLAAVLHVMNYKLQSRQQFGTSELDRSLARMLTYGILFCGVDLLWGLCDCNIIQGEKAFFIVTSVFLFAMVLSPMFCMEFFIVFLKKQVTHKKSLKVLCAAALILQISLIVANCFTPILFRIENGRYTVKTYRYISFLNQYVLYVVIAVVCFLCVRKSKESFEKKHFSLFCAALTPVFFGILTYSYPEAPFYTFGYFVECSIIYFFIMFKERSETVRNSVLNAISDTYYTMHLFDLRANSMEDFIEAPIVNGLIGDRSDAQAALNDVMRMTTTDGYRDSVLEFVNLSTLPERLQDCNIVSMDFVGSFHGWARASFIAIDRDDAGVVYTVMYTTQIIEDQKKKEAELLNRSTTDPLTGLLNRSAYEEDMNNLTGKEDNLVLVSIDVNGLKVVNDTMGHLAGDELLSGAAECIKKCFGAYGKTYRIGGDEFAVILFSTKKQLQAIKEDFDETVASWSGQFLDELSVSRGYIMSSEAPELSLRGLAQAADERMYRDKEAFYSRQGMDRRGQSEAQRMLLSLYTKILRINLSADSFAVVKVDLNERTLNAGHSEKFSEEVKNFVTADNVHPDDTEEFLRQFDFDFLGQYFDSGKRILNVRYRRRHGEDYKPVVTQLVPAEKYSPENRVLFMYVKDFEG